MSKTPYEIRLELLQLATSTLTNRVKANPHGTCAVNYEPSTEEIMKEADKMNGFVSTGTCECKDCSCDPCKCSN